MLLDHLITKHNIYFPLEGHEWGEGLCGADFCIHFVTDHSGCDLGRQYFLVLLLFFFFLIEDEH